jgi:S1-C subfamily serine protease
VLSTDLILAIPGLTVNRPNATRIAVAALVVFVTSAYLCQGSDQVGAAELTTSKPAGFADIVAKVKPAVIAVTVRLENDLEVEDKDEPDAPSESQPFSENSPLYRYFFGSPKYQPHSGPAREIKTALGSGFFISSDGYAVTNDHVVQHGVSFMIATEDGTTYKARAVGADLRTDLALLKVDGRNDFPYVKLSDHEPRIGDWVIAVGNPYGLAARLRPASCRHSGAGSTPTLTTISFRSTRPSIRATPEARVLTWMGRLLVSTRRFSPRQVARSGLASLYRPQP